MIERMLVAVLARGHCLLEGVPGVAKTLAVETLATVVGGTLRPDPVHPRPGARPTSWAPGSTGRPARSSTSSSGPVFVNFLLADEINRAPAKVQSALLEVMAEQQVSIGGQTYEVPRPFLVMATQNPIEQEGVYPLPEAQRDRFLLKIVVGLPDRHRGARDRLPDGREAARAAARCSTRPQLIAAAGARPTRCSSTTRWSTTRYGWCWRPGSRPSTACRTSPS